MRLLWHVALHDLRLHLAERSNVFFLLLMPLGFIFFFSFVNRDTGSSQPTVSLPVVDRDGDFLSLAFVEQLRGEAFDVPVYDAAAADTTEFGTRWVTIPDSFTARVLAARPTKIELRAGSTSNADYNLAATTRLFLAQVRFLGNLVRWVDAGDSSLADPDVTISVDDLDPADKGRLLAMVAEPPRVEVASRNAGGGRPVPSGTKQSIPGVTVMFVIMTVLIGGSSAITAEKKQGTLRRLATTPLSSRQVLLGKTLGLTLLGLTQAAILVVCSEGLTRMHLLGMDFLWTPHLVGLIPLLAAYCACVAALGVLMSGILRTPQQAESLAWLVGMALSALGGAWWPLEIMGPTAQAFGLALPTTWAMKGLHGLVTYGHGPAAVLAPVAVLLLMGTIFWLVGSRLLRVTD